MKIKTWLKYEVPYPPPRCRNFRYERKEEYVDLNLREVSFKDLVLSYEDKSFNGKGEIYRYAGKLWAKCKLNPYVKREYKKIKTPLEWLIYHNMHYSTYFAGRFSDKDSSRETVLKRAKDDLRKLILVDGELYEFTRKPEYFIMTFGCGHNDGTGLFVEYPARRDCGWRFPATKGKEAVALANKIAKERGDTDDVGKFKAWIVCH